MCFGKKSIHEHQPVAFQPREMELAQSLFVQARRRVIEHWLERQSRDWRNVREAPVLVFQCGKAQFSEAGNAGLANREEPGRVLARSFLFEALKLLQIRISVGGVIVRA